MPSFVQVVPQCVGLPVIGVIGPGDGSSCWQWVRLLGVLLVEGGGKDDGDDGDYDDQHCDLLHYHINNHQHCDTRSITMYMTCLKAGSKQCANFVTIFIRLLLLVLWCRAVWELFVEDIFLVIWWSGWPLICMKGKEGSSYPDLSSWLSEGQCRRGRWN